MCKSCQEQFNPRFINFEIEGVKGLSIYEYDDNIKNLLYLFKGCYDVELANVFLYRFKKELNMLYKGYVLVPAASYHEDDEKRGFKHIIKMFENINLPFAEVIKKISPFKQAEHNKKERKEIRNHLIIENKEWLRDKKVLIVDDVCTTGSTIKSMIELIKTANPKKIKILVMSKRE